MTQTTLDMALERVGQNNEPWLAWARSQAQTISTLRGSVTSDDVRREADRMGLQPDSPHAWGALFKAKGWRWVGREPSMIASNNGRFVSRWRWER